MAYIIDDLEPTDEWIQLFGNVSETETYVAYKLNDGELLFEGIYEEDFPLDDEYILVPVSSTYDGYTKVGKGTIFSNVMRSTGDKPRGKYRTNSWLAFMKKIYAAHNWSIKVLNQCCTDTIFYHNNTNTNLVNPTCKVAGRIVGGHVLLNCKNPRTVKVGSDDKNLYLLPICNTHNIAKIPKGSWAGTNYYMKVGHDDIYAIKLSNYKLNYVRNEIIANNRLENYKKI